jgi:hypothetical protein
VADAFTITAVHLHEIKTIAAATGREVMMGDGVKRPQASEDFLRKLALDPNQAIRHWKRLKPGEQLSLITYMTTAYGSAFAKEFKKEAEKYKGPALGYTVTNSPFVTPESLTKQGFKFSRWITPPNVGGGWPTASIWVHPTGKEVWLIQPAKGAPARVPANPRPLAHPDIDELQFYLKEYSARKEDMIRKGREIEARRPSLSKPQYKQLRKEWWDDYEAWDGELDDIFNEIIPDMADDLTPDERRQKNELIDKLKALQAGPWPADVFDPPD